jgi:SAM-dependent methyltransferase
MTPATLSSLPGEAQQPRWVATQCAQCGDTAGESFLSIPQPDAPGGVAHVWKCSTCGLKRLSPRPTAQTISEYYASEASYNAFEGRRRSARSQKIWDFLRDTYSNPPGVRTSVRLAAPIGRLLADWAFDINIAIDGRTGLRVLEVGSGYGDILIYLKSRGCQVVGTDPSPAAAAKAAESGIDVRVGELLDMGFPAQSFDVAFLSHSLEHVPDPNAELRELHRVLLPGGWLHIAVPNGSASRLITDGLYWDHLSHPSHFWYFDPDNLTRMVRRHGFELVAPIVTTTRHHAIGRWLTEIRTRGFIPSTKSLLRYFRTALYNPDGGDILRLVARRV